MVKTYNFIKVLARYDSNTAQNISINESTAQAEHQEKQPEMTLEEKAKAYDDLKGRIKAAIKGIEDFENLPDSEKYKEPTEEEIKKMFGL